MLAADQKLCPALAAMPAVPVPDSISPGFRCPCLSYFLM